MTSMWLVSRHVARYSPAGSGSGIALRTPRSPALNLIRQGLEREPKGRTRGSLGAVRVILGRQAVGLGHGGIAVEEADRQRAIARIGFAQRGVLARSGLGDLHRLGQC